MQPKRTTNVQCEIIFFFKVKSISEQKWILSQFRRVRLCDTMQGSPPGSSVHGIPQARILEWVAISFSKGSSRLRGRTHVSSVPCISRRFFTTSATWEACIRTQTAFEISTSVSSFLLNSSSWEALQAHQTKWVKSNVFSHPIS